MIELRNKLSANLGFLWKELPIHQQIISAAKAGFKHIELHSPYNDINACELKELCDIHHLNLVCINTPIQNKLGSHFGLASVPKSEQQFFSDMLQALQYCSISKSPLLHVMAGVTEDQFYSDAEKTLQKNLIIASEMASQYNVNIILEPVSRKNVPGYFYKGSLHIIEILNTLNLTNIGLLLDLYNSFSVEENPSNIIYNHANKIFHVQISSVPDRSEPDLSPIVIDSMIALDETKYEGFIGCEYIPLKNVEDGLKWINTLEHKLRKTN